MADRTRLIVDGSAIAAVFERGRHKPPYGMCRSYAKWFLETVCGLGASLNNAPTPLPHFRSKSRYRSFTCKPALMRDSYLLGVPTGIRTPVLQNTICDIRVASRHNMQSFREPSPTEVQGSRRSCDDLSVSQCFLSACVVFDARATRDQRKASPKLSQRAMLRT